MTRGSGGRSLLVLSVTVMAAVLAVTAQQRELRLVSTIWPPFTNQPGQARFALDLVEAAFERIGVATITAFVDNVEFTTALASGPFDGSPAVWRDSRREQVALFSDPYLENRLVLIGRSGANVAATSLAALKGRRIAVVEGYAYGDIDSLGPVFVRSSSEETSISLLLRQAVDYVLMDALVVQYLVDNYPDQARTRLQIGTTPLLTRPLYIALRRTLPDAQALINKFNQQIKQMITDRTYHRLLHVDWIRADVDGDGLLENVAASDRWARTAPTRTYDLFSEAALDAAVKKQGAQERYFFGGAVYNGWSSVPDHFKVDHLDRPDHTHPTARIFTFNWK
jgi:polar amino acid transport system substrate-binding protein